MTELERCILRAGTIEGYKAVLEANVAASHGNRGSLLNALMQQCKTLQLMQTIPACAACPAPLTVVDLIPATAGILSEETTVIVLPPSWQGGADAQDTKSSGTAGEGVVRRDGSKGNCGNNNGNFGNNHTNNDCGADNFDTNDVRTDDILEDVCVVLQDFSLRCSTAVASREFLRQTLVPGGALVCVGDEEYTTAFILASGEETMIGRTEGVEGDTELQESETIDTPDRKSECKLPTLHVSPDVFRNIRASLLLDLLPTFVMGRVRFGEQRLLVESSRFRPVESDTGVPLVPKAGDVASGTGGMVDFSLKTLVLEPAWPKFVLNEVLGDKHERIITAALHASRLQLHGRIVAVGDVLVVRVTPCLMVEEQMDHNTVLDAVIAHAAHMVTQSDVRTKVTSALLHEDAIAIPFRAVEVLSTTGMTFGRITLVNVDSSFGSGRLTEVKLTLCSSWRSADATPLFPPVPSSRVAETFYSNLTLTMKVRKVVQSSYSPLAASTVHVVVVHAVKENMPLECISAALSEVGVEGLVVDLDRKSSVQMQSLIEAYMKSMGEVALVIRNAQQLKEHPELLHLFDEDENISDVANTAVSGDGGCGGVDSRCLHNFGVRMVFLVCECVEAPVPIVAAQARNTEGVLKGTNPSDEERCMIIKSLLTNAGQSYGFQRSLLLSFETLASWTVGLSVADISAFVQECVCTLKAMHLPDGARPVLSESLCGSVLKKFQKAHGHSLVSTRLQPVRWSDVGGLEDAKRELREMIQLPLLYPELLGSESSARQGAGILFYGPPGCGKTLLAKAVATEMNMNFMSVKGPELINQYVGESEKNIRLLFQRARDNSPCIIFFDELDALAPARGAKGDAGGAMDRVVAQLLVEVDGVGHRRSDGTAADRVFIIGATNRPDLLDPSLLRPGRFDKLCYLGIPGTRSEQLVTLRALTRKFDLAKDVDFEVLLEPMSFEYTGADLFALCSDAMMFAVDAMLNHTPQGELTDNPAPSVASSALVVRMCDFVRARDQLKPSVTPEDLRRYESLRTNFSRRQ
ncbi:putative peroxisome assembly protein [Trypanosoma vivax]|nr:putative peroxisome assembly protein [Trypanosoma vivax]